MILQALYDYYQRKVSDPDSGIAREGFELKAIPFLIVIDQEGTFIDLEDTRSGEGKIKAARPFMIPRSKGRSGSKSYETVQLLWDHIGYVACVPRGGEAKDLELAKLQHAVWLQSLDSLSGRLGESASVLAIRQFYKKNQLENLTAHPLFEGARKIPGCNITFRLVGAESPVPCDVAVADAVRLETMAFADSGNEGTCLITGERAPIARTHTQTPISKDSKCLVSFQRNAGYDSYGKDQAANAPVSTAAEFAYTTALGLLLAKDSQNKMRVGDATTVFWSQKRSEFEDFFASFFTLPKKDNPDDEILAVRSLYESFRTGSMQSESDTPFFVLGLAPNSARISVRFWHQGTIKECATHLQMHFNDLEIVRGANDHGRYSLFWILVETANEGKIDNVQPNLAGAIVRAILDGHSYPAQLLHQVVRRIRAEQVRRSRADTNVSRTRAAILKACLNRFQRTHPSKEKEITVALDLDNNNPGYRLGRLFAALEKIQEDASPGLNATIRDRFYGAASASPVTAFPQLLKLKNHHLKKMDNPRFVGAHEKRLTEIMSGLPTSMPAHLKMDDQARFAIGYYHQRQAFFTKAASVDQNSEPSNNTNESK